MTARLSNASLTALSAPTFVFAGFELANRVLLPEFLTHSVGLEIGIAGLIITFVRLLDIVLDTVIGAMSDAGVSSRWGRRRTWMLLGAPVAIGGTLAVFATPASAGPIGVTAWLVAMTTGWAMINSAHGAWAFEIASGMEERSRVFAARTIAGLLGYLGFSALLAATGPKLGDQVAWIAGCIALGVPVTTLLLFRRVADPPAPRRPISWGALAAPLFISIDTQRKRRLTLLFCLVGAHTAIGSASFVYLVKYGVGAPDAVGPALLCQSVAMAAGLPLLVLLSRRIGARATLILMFSVEAAISLSALLLPFGQDLPVIVWAALRGFGAGMDFVLLRAYAGEEMDEEARRTGQSRAGAYYAAFHLYFNLFSALATGALFAAFDYAGLGQSPAGADRPSPLYLLIPVLAGAAIHLLALATTLRWPPTSAGTTEHTS